MILNRLSTILKQHYLAIILAGVVGIIMLLPHLFLVRELGEKYEGISIADVDSDYYYLARISSAYEKDYAISQATVKSDIEPKPYTSPPLGENFVALLARILQVSPAQMSVIGNFLFSFLLALVLYAIAFKLSNSKLVAIFVPLVILTSSNFLFEPRDLLDLFRSPQGLRINSYNRPIHPQISSLFFFTWLLSLINWLWRPRQWLLVVSGILCGLLFYIYPFSWILAVSILSSLFIFSLFRKNYQQAWGLAGIGFTALLVSVLYWKNFWDFMQHPMYEEMQKRFVIFTSHKPIWSKLLALDTIFLLFIYWKNLSSKTAQILFACILGLWIVLNQQIITGIRLFPGHWHWYYVVPFTFIVIVLFVRHLFLRFPKLWISFIIVGIGISLANGVIAQKTYLNHFISKYRSYQRYASVYKWLDENLPKGSVILSDTQFSERLPIYTSHFRYAYQPTDELFLVPRDQLKNGFFTSIYIEGARPDNIGQYIKSDTWALREIVLGYYRQYAEDCFQCYTKEELDSLRQEYIAFYQANLETRFEQYELDYIVTDTGKDVIIDFGTFDFIEQAAVIGEFEIYKVN